MCAQNDIVGNVERVLGISGGMARRDIQRFEVVVGLLDFRTVLDGVTHGNEDVFDLLAGDRQRMTMAEAPSVSGQGDVDAFALEGSAGFDLRKVFC